MAGTSAPIEGGDGWISVRGVGLLIAVTPDVKSPVAAPGLKPLLESPSPLLLLLLPLPPPQANRIAQVSALRMSVFVFMMHLKVS